MDSDFRNTHCFLVDGPDRLAAVGKVNHFFASTVLVRYDQVVLVEEECCSATDAGFPALLARNIERNRELLAKLLGELAEEGFADLKRWSAMPQGYLSKTVHAAAHLLDGFFGVDSAFYNLIDDSHWVSDPLRERIEKSPDRFWLVTAVGLSRLPEADRIPFLRRHGRE
ncbi:MAG: hypothetical protein ACOY4H_14930 [Thermodesulfobacteriota bacterium]